MGYIRLISAGVALLLLTGIEPLHAEADAPPQTGGGPPPDHCRDMFARISAQIAYLGPQLGLDQAQQPLWERWQQKVLAAASAEQSRCCRCWIHEPRDTAMRYCLPQIWASPCTNGWVSERSTA